MNKFKEMNNEEQKLMIKNAKKLLFSTLNCCETQIIPVLETLGIYETDLLLAVTALAGGISNQGSTCGVVLGGAINFALLHLDEALNQGLKGEIILLYNIKDYIKAFKENFNSTLCRDRTELDFNTIKGKLGLLIPQKVKGCVRQTEFSLQYLLKHEYQTEYDIGNCPSELHCAREVLAKIRKNKGIGNKTLEKISVVFDGGIGLSGNTCGALIGGLMSLGLKFGRKHTIQDARKIRNMFKAYPKKFTRQAYKLIREFTAQYQELECTLITRKTFKNWCDFQAQRSTSFCNKVVEFVVVKVTEIIKTH